jgi:hypothetical protein
MAAHGAAARRVRRRWLGHHEEEGGHRVGRMLVGPAWRENNEESGLGRKDDWAEMENRLRI